VRVTALTRASQRQPAMRLTLRSLTVARSSLCKAQPQLSGALGLGALPRIERYGSSSISAFPKVYPCATGRTLARRGASALCITRSAPSLSGRSFPPTGSGIPSLPAIQRRSHDGYEHKDVRSDQAGCALALSGLPGGASLHESGGTFPSCGHDRHDQHDRLSIEAPD
jgi:hypothetical protein